MALPLSIRVCAALDKRFPAIAWQIDNFGNVQGTTESLVVDVCWHHKEAVGDHAAEATGPQAVFEVEVRIRTHPLSDPKQRHKLAKVDMDPDVVHATEEALSAAVLHLRARALEMEDYLYAPTDEKEK